LKLCGFVAGKKSKAYIRVFVTKPQTKSQNGKMHGFLSKYAFGVIDGLLITVKGNFQT